MVERLRFEQSVQFLEVIGKQLAEETKPGFKFEETFATTKTEFSNLWPAFVSLFADGGAGVLREKTTPNEAAKAYLRLLALPESDLPKYFLALPESDLPKYFTAEQCAKLNSIFEEWHKPVKAKAEAQAAKAATAKKTVKEGEEEETSVSIDTTKRRGFTLINIAVGPLEALIEKAAPAISQEEQEIRDAREALVASGKFSQDSQEWMRLVSACVGRTLDAGYERVGRQPAGDGFRNNMICAKTATEHAADELFSGIRELGNKPGANFADMVTLLDSARKFAKESLGITR